MHSTSGGTEITTFSGMPLKEMMKEQKPFLLEFYVSYVDAILRYFRDRAGFTEFADLKDYFCFEGAVIDFCRFYGLKEYNLKENSKYIWQIGKE